MSTLITIGIGVGGAFLGLAAGVALALWAIKSTLDDVLDKGID